MIKLHIRRIRISEPTEREDGTEYCNIAIAARGLTAPCTMLRIIGDADECEALKADLEQLTVRTLEVDLEVTYKPVEYDDGARTVVHANADLHELGCVLDDALDALGL